MIEGKTNKNDNENDSLNENSTASPGRTFSGGNSEKYAVRVRLHSRILQKNNEPEWGIYDALKYELCQVSLTIKRWSSVNHHRWSKVYPPSNWPRPWISFYREFVILSIHSRCCCPWYMCLFAAWGRDPCNRMHCLACTAGYIQRELLQPS